MAFPGSVDARKIESPDLGQPGWSCICSFILIAVTGALTLVFALTRFGAVSGQGAARVEDFTAYARRHPSVNSSSPRTPPNISARPGFFLDIGAVSRSVRGSTRTRHLERKGWPGICAVPFPGDFSGRTCKVVALPVSGVSGEKVQVQDCSRGPPQAIERLVTSLTAQTPPCPHVEAKSVGILDLLSLAEAPPVIDFIALDTHGSELDILKHFPFDDFCVRAWTVKHNYDDAKMAAMRQIFEVAHGCRVREGAGEYWARCICDKRGRALPAGVAPAPQGPDESDAVKHRKGKSMVVMADGHATMPMVRTEEASKA